MQDQLGTWTIKVTGLAVSASTPKTAIQYAASSSNTAEVLYISISQSGSTTSAMEQFRLVRKSAAATVTAGVTGTSVLDLTGGAGTFRGTLSTSTTGITASAEGTDSDEVFRFSFNTLSGYERDFQPNARVWVPASGIIGIKLAGIIASPGTGWDVSMTVREMK
jgi:hypothetical protein